MPKTRPLTPAENQAMGDAAELIRTHLWLGNRPPRYQDSRPWTMGRDLSIWKRLLFTGRTPPEINGVIENVRGVLRHLNQDEKLTMRCLYFDRATAVYEQARSRWIQGQEAETFGPHGTGKLPPRVRSILRGMVQ